MDRAFTSWEWWVRLLYVVPIMAGLTRLVYEFGYRQNLHLNPKLETLLCGLAGLVLGFGNQLLTANAFVFFDKVWQETATKAELLSIVGGFVIWCLLTALLFSFANYVGDLVGAAEAKSKQT